MRKFWENKLLDILHYSIDQNICLNMSFDPNKKLKWLSQISDKTGNWTCRSHVWKKQPGHFYAIILQQSNIMNKWLNVQIGQYCTVYSEAHFPFYAIVFF